MSTGRYFWPAGDKGTEPVFVPGALPWRGGDNNSLVNGLGDRLGLRSYQSLVAVTNSFVCSVYRLQTLIVSISRLIVEYI